MLQFTIHYGIHFIVPLIVAYFFFRSKWITVYVILVATMVIDLDHFLATPIFDANRCSINFHPLHSYYAIIGYVVLSLIKKTRIVGIGCLIHILADSADCLMMSN